MKSLNNCGLMMPYGGGNRSTLVEVMAWCLMAPSHYLNQSLVTPSAINLRAISQEILPGRYISYQSASTTEISLKITCGKFHSNLEGANELNSLT